MKGERRKIVRTAASACITPHVSKPILRAPRDPSDPIFLAIIDEPDPIARIRAVQWDRTPEAQEDGARAVDGVARLEAREELCVRRGYVWEVGVAGRGIGPLGEQRRRWTRRG